MDDDAERKEALRRRNNRLALALGAFVVALMVLSMFVLSGVSP